MKKLEIKYFIYTIAVLILFLLVIPTVAEAKTYYTWVDKHGVTHITENKDEIPSSRIGTIKSFESTGRFDFITTNYYYVKNNSHKFIRYFVYLLILFIAFIVIRKAIKNISKSRNEKKLNKHLQEIESSGISGLSTYQLKLKISEVLENMGYMLKSPDTQFEGLIDYIGYKHGEKYAISIHESENLVSKIVVSEIDREKFKHSCEKTIIVSTSFFEEDVAEYAKSIGCELIDKKKLSSLILNN